MLRSVGIDQRATMDIGQGVYAVAELNIRYLRPAKLGDDLLIRSAVERVRAASVLIRQRIWRGDEQLIDAQVTAAFLTMDGRPKRQSKAWVELFEALPARSREGTTRL